MKVHFASCLSLPKVIDKAGIAYVLDTFYEIKQLKMEKRISHLSWMNQKKHAIIDSGLFTMMFGAKAGTPISEQFIIDWQDDYARTVNASNYQHSIVDCDVQKVLSPEFAWEMRKKFKTQVKNTIINVYHLEDGNPDKLIAFSDYIAVSIPELRFNVSRAERYKITDYISRKATLKGKRVHLLGCTEKEMMKRFSYCYSCDSTSWKSGGRYNSHKTEAYGHFSVEQMSKNKLSDFTSVAQSNFYYQAITKLEDYKKFAGDQT